MTVKLTEWRRKWKYGESRERIQGSGVRVQERKGCDILAGRLSSGQELQGSGSAGFRERGRRETDP